MPLLPPLLAACRRVSLHLRHRANHLADTAAEGCSPWVLPPPPFSTGFMPTPVGPVGGPALAPPPPLRPSSSANSASVSAACHGRPELPSIFRSAAAAAAIGPPPRSSSFPCTAAYCTVRRPPASCGVAPLVMDTGRKRKPTHVDEPHLAARTSGQLHDEPSCRSPSDLGTAVSQPRLVRRRLGKNTSVASDVLPSSLSFIGATKEERWHKGFYNVIKPCLMHSPVAISKAQIRLNALFMCFRVQILNFNAFHVLQACNQGLHLMKNKRVTILDVYKSGLQ
ncbi:uncharacterized protein [Miscanthus floridulus]|uniref:uncharacterized protein isoform X2 n=1 Tax=Miscanthus floridulus TaxID=154761 RepID=UPI0034599B6E